MRRVDKITLLAFAAAFALTAAVSAAVGYSAGVADGSNLYFTYPSFRNLVDRPVKPDLKDKTEVARYENDGREYVEAAERYLNNALSDITRISSEADLAADEANDFISEYNTVMLESY